MDIFLWISNHILNNPHPTPAISKSKFLTLSDPIYMLQCLLIIPPHSRHIQQLNILTPKRPSARFARHFRNDFYVSLPPFKQKLEPNTVFSNRDPDLPNNFIRVISKEKIFYSAFFYIESSCYSYSSLSISRLWSYFFKTRWSDLL